MHQNEEGDKPTEEDCEIIMMESKVMTNTNMKKFITVKS
jgi:hypothetical protein